MTINIPEKILVEYFIKNHVRKAILFGSYARGTADEQSDIDILIDFESGYTPGLRIFCPTIYAMKHILPEECFMPRNDMDRLIDYVQLWRQSCVFQLIKRVRTLIPKKFRVILSA
ncbi:MAG TPA: hypothetical protein DC049_04810 [Spirochaetia bacterium]|nr:hypothetical protein [Spirochaetia bacterium]